jgi:hypothetical protein
VTKKLWPLVAVALVAGCGGKAPAETGAATGKHGHATDQGKAVKFAQCIREHGVPHFPDPDAKGDFVFGIDVSPAVWKRAVDACKDFEHPAR